MNIAFYLHDEPDPARCRAELLALKSRFRMISAEEVRAFYAGKISLKHACHLTIDDGWISTYEVVFPLLKELEIPASIFVSPKACAEGGSFWYQEIKAYDCEELKRILTEEKVFSEGILAFPLDLIVKEMKIDEVNALLEKYRERHGLGVPARAVVNVAELREMANSGLVEVGAHTITHPVLANETSERSEREIAESVAQLGDILGTQVKSFAYPNGLPGTDFGIREIDFVKKTGAECAYSVKPGVLGAGGDAFAIPRVGSLKRVSLGRLGLILPSLHDQVAPRLKIRKFKK